MDKVEQVDREAASSWADLHGDLSVLGHKLLSALFARHRQQAIAAARPLIEREAWRPIETAPKDGTRILIARAGENVGPDELEITEWCSLRREHWEHIEGDLYRKVQDAPEEFWNGNGHRATHWMPLPEPPAAIRALSEKDGQER